MHISPNSALVDDVLADIGIIAGGYDKGRTRIHSMVGLFGGQDSTRAQEHLGNFLGDDSDAVLRAGSAEGDLSSGQSTSGMPISYFVDD